MSFMEVKAEMGNLQHAWHEFKQANDERLEEIRKRGAADGLTEEKTDRLNREITEQKRRLDRLETALSRPESGGGGAFVPTEGMEHRRAFLAYVRKGVDSGLEALEKKALSAGSNADGGYLTPNALSEMIAVGQTQGSVLRQLATVETITADALDVIDDHTSQGAGWTTETGAVSDSTTPTFGRTSIDTYEMYAQPKATQKLLDDAALDVEAWLARKITEQFTVLENTAFIAGDGSGKPRGLLDYPAGTSWGQAERILTGGAGTVTADSLIALFYSLRNPYAAKASFIMARGLVEMARKLKDTTGQYLWSPGLSAGRSDTLLGAPVFVDADMPAPAANSLSAMFGDFASAYRIVDRMGVRILRDPFTEKPYVKFYATKRVGGAAVNFDAYKVLKLGTA